MTRHGKNSTAGSVYTYHEKKKDAKQSGYGSLSLRLGKDSIKDFDCCCLTLQPCHNPVVTEDGYLYDKEAILEYIIHQKCDYAKKLKEFERQKAKAKKEVQQLADAERSSQLKSFVHKQSATVKTTGDASCSSHNGSNMASGMDKQLPSFWIPSLTPAAKPTEMKKPDDKVTCPMSGNPLKMKNLIDVKFTSIKDDDKRSLITKDARYVCAVTNDILSNSVPCAVLRTSGCVVTMECVEQIIKKDWIDPTNGKKMTKNDVIQLQRGACGFSSAGIVLEAKIDGPVMQA